MIHNINLEKVIKTATGCGGEFADIYYEDSRVTSLTWEGGRVEHAVQGRDIGVGMRLIADLHTFYAYANEVTEAKLMELAGLVSRSHAAGAPGRVMPLTKKPPGVLFPVETPAGRVSLQDKLKYVERAAVAAQKYNAQVRQVRVVYGDALRNIVIAAATGELVEMEKHSLVFMVQVVAGDGERIQTGYEVIGGIAGWEQFAADPPEQVAEKAAARAVMMLKAPRAPAGEMPVVIAGEAGGTMIHEAVGHGLEADLVQQGFSVYSGRLGEKVASPLITVVDDATLPGRRGSFAFDDEGVAGRCNVLVEKGILKSFLYDRLTALKDRAVSTGNGRRESYAFIPIPRMSNTMIMPGSDDPDAIIRSLARGLLVKRMGGGQVNTVTGDFVFEVSEGYLVEKGQIGDPVRGATLTGNGPEVLKRIDMVGRDQGFSLGTCGKDGQRAPVADAQPTLRISALVVGGEVK